MRKNKVRLDPFEDVEFKRVYRALPKVLTVQEMNRPLGCIRTEGRALAGMPTEETFLTVRDRALLETLYSAALRVSELCNLNWEDLDIAKRELRVMHARATKKGCVPSDSTRSMPC